MDNVIKAVLQQDLTGSSIQKATNNKFPIHLYKDLLNMNNLDEILGKNNACIILFPVKSSTDGHWICIIYYEDDNILHFFDPYGFNWDAELKYSQDPITKENVISRIFRQAQQQGINTTYNKNRYQKLADNVTTCGDHTATRLRFRYLKEDEYAKLMFNQKYSPDEMVTMLTFMMVDDNMQDKKLIKRIINKS